ncbi:acyl-CoA N-acyltransferase [Penicillium capsulatum]|uniref:Acyl-CoA N-acyltransferase n=1 Tax=Penicillium capsulatum TaxID=69766 RepID=A0A9W9LMS7_9EURO|nr:acyl-CoA N-acyltransferase [Penicillium capsulatum]KAJ6108886.1 acyl-CoA N-acyltransferase [Penicillium capsulatum]
MNPVDFPALAGLNAFARLLSVGDVDSCVDVENAFPEQERCSREKFLYRLTVCPELCRGLFVEPPDSKGQARLIGHVIATRVSANRVIDASMEMPSNWQGSTAAVVNEDQVIGNDPNGLSVGVHSLAINPAYQGKGIGRALMEEYVHYIQTSVQPVTSLVIIAHGHLIRFYESLGFTNLGPSPCAFGGGGWYDMLSNFRPGYNAEASISTSPIPESNRLDPLGIYLIIVSD